MDNTSCSAKPSTLHTGIWKSFIHTLSNVLVSIKQVNQTGCKHTVHLDDVIQEQFPPIKTLCWHFCAEQREKKTITFTELSVVRQIW